MTENTTPESPQDDENTAVEVTTPEAGSDAPQDDTDTFSREDVQKLRNEAAEARTRARDAEYRLHTELVRATGKLADPTDLPFDRAHLTDPDKLADDITDLLARKPHLKARTVSGDAGQGVRGDVAAPTFASLFQQGI
ncbi:hypothetical protein HZU38_18870 [Mycolicibacterium vanbaalenii]|uniref:hypothetical protein n=1 Tax=Mycolicibacterium vanbaalenii TaxID=110539 RepID=UPI001F1E0747|nr:hypothetical protein [Mycolicibacterium vanbaalenii]UJL27006.1 hypothetical protein HZU38_18870 [Mycolicibacterium vanbaalenii]WND59129.1 hypothetical protein QQA43_12475 [Mycolicibacterium vanbaalenii]